MRAGGRLGARRFAGMFVRDRTLGHLMCTVMPNIATAGIERAVVPVVGSSSGRTFTPGHRGPSRKQSVRSLALALTLLCLTGCACDRLSFPEGSDYGCGAGYGQMESDARGRLLAFAELDPRNRVMTYVGPETRLATIYAGAFHVTPDTYGEFIATLASDGLTVWSASGDKVLGAFPLHDSRAMYKDVLSTEERGTWICVPSAGTRRFVPGVGSPPVKILRADGSQQRLGEPPIDSITRFSAYCVETRDVFILCADGSVFIVNRDDERADWSGSIGFEPVQYGCAVIGRHVYLAHGSDLVRFDVRARRVAEQTTSFGGHIAYVSHAVGRRFVVAVTRASSPGQVRSELVGCEAGEEGQVSVVWRQEITNDQRVGQVVYMAAWGAAVVSFPDRPPRVVPFPR